MQCFVVLVAPAGIQFAKLSVLIRFDLSGSTILLVTAPQIDECHVLTLIHLSKDCGEIRLFIAGISFVGTWLMAVYQFVDRMVRDPFRSGYNSFSHLSKVRMKSLISDLLALNSSDSSLYLRPSTYRLIMMLL